MKISNWEFHERADTAEVAAEVDGYRLWYRFPKAHPASRAADPFVAAALLPAMLRGEKIEIDPSLSVSPRLLVNLRTLQEVHHCWNPIFKIIPIEGRLSPAAPLNGGAMSFFSGGVDSTYTFLKRVEELTHLVFIQGFDFFANVDDPEPFSVEDLSDLAQLAHKLRHPREAASRFLSSSLSAKTRQALADYGNPGPPAGGLEAGLAEDLKAMILGPPIWEAGRFAGVRLRPETKELSAQIAPGEDSRRLNRLILEDAYPHEIARRNGEIYKTAIDRNTRFARSFGKTLIPVSTNYFPFGYRYNLSRNLTQGSTLASIALLLGFPRVYIPASPAYDQIFPMGSHPLTDRLWSNEAVEMVHDGAESRRIARVTKIAGNAPALANLRVCFEDMNVNCGRCSKCLRTMIALRLLGVAAAPFPALPPLKAIAKIRVGDDISMFFYWEHYQYAQEVGKDEDLCEALGAVVKRYDRKVVLKGVDRAFLGGFLKKALRSLGKTDRGIRRIDTLAPKD